LAGLLTRGYSRGAGAVLVKPQIMASSKQLQLLFLLKSGFSTKIFGRTSLKEPQPELEKSHAK